MPRTSLFAAGLLAVALAAGGCADSAGSVSPVEPGEAESKIVRTSAAPVLRDNWIVLFDERVESVDVLVAELRERFGIGTTAIYRHAVKGFAGMIPPGSLDGLAADPRVTLIEPVSEVHADAQTVGWGVSSCGANASSTLSGNGSGSVTGVEIYILDTGIDLDHPDLNVNTALSVNYTNDASADDGHGHGTHCAGIAAAYDNTSFAVGVAPGAPVIAVKVLSNSGSGYNSWVMQGLDYVAGRRVASTTPMVANMSLGGPGDRALDATVRGAIDDGVIVVCAAGNDGHDALLQSPARVAEAITVGAYASSGNLASFSNYGRRVDINAPGVSIYSTYKNGGAASLSGTSMAAPFVAGGAALYVSRPGNASKTQLQVRNQLVADARTLVNPGRPKTTARALNVAGY